jgi:hypothetical protein
MIFANYYSNAICDISPYDFTLAHKQKNLKMSRHENAAEEI